MMTTNLPATATAIDFGFESSARKEAPARLGAFGTMVLFLTVGVTPMLDSMPGVGPLSMAWFWYAGLGLYVFFCHGEALLKAAFQPPFIAAFMFVGIGVVMEGMQGKPAFTYLLRFTQTVLGGLMIAALCRTRNALKVGIWAVALLALGASIVLLKNDYGQVAGAQVEGFGEASLLREEVSSKEGFFKDLNRIGFLCGMGAVGAFVLGMTGKGIGPRLFWLGVSAVCFLGSAMTFSRSAMAVALAGGAVVMVASGKRLLLPLLIAVSILGCALYALFPPAVLQRYRLVDDTQSQKPEARQNVFRKVIAALPLYWEVGVGSGNYKQWAREQGITVKQGEPVGAHNSFFQVWIFWGLLSLVSFTIFLWTAYRCLPRRCVNDPLSLALLGIGVTMFLRLGFTHNFYVKDFAMVLGLLAGAGLWIWPDRLVPEPTPDQSK